MPSSQTNYHQWALMDDLIASSPHRALLAFSQRWPASVGGALPLDHGVLAVGEGMGDFLQGGFCHLSIIWGAHLG